MPSNYAAHGVTLSFAWFLVANVIASALVAAATRVLSRDNATTPARWLLMRLAPAAASVLFVTVLFIPSYWKYEPREAVEGFDLTLTLVAALAGLLVAASVVRGLLAWRAAAQRVGRWVQHARVLPKATAAWATPIFIVDSDQAFIALSGIRRHRLLVTRGLVDALSGAELAAAIAHELGHRRAWDNLKRLAMRSAPDILTFTPAARHLERRWASAAEHAADGAAASAPAERCALASALVKDARLSGTPSAMATGMPPSEPISTLIGGADITSRVQRLLEDRPPLDQPRAYGPALGVSAVFLVLLTYDPTLRLVHDITERLLRLLP
jgi:Zn-dependent protease with chaperone function